MIKGYRITFNENQGEISLKNRQIAPLSNNLFGVKNEKVCSISEPMKCSHFWHRVFGHR